VNTSQTLHHYVEPTLGEGVAERLMADRVIGFLYNTARETPSTLQRIAASKRLTQALASWEFDRPLFRPQQTIGFAVQRMGIDLSDALGDPAHWRTLRELFERQIRYWESRPLPSAKAAIVSPADGKLLHFGGGEDAMVSVKRRFFSVPELLAKPNWAAQFSTARGVSVRLTPEVYHYVHAPVSGVVLDVYDVDGAYHSCNPTALVSFDSPYMLNRRRVVVLNTDVPGGSQVGAVAVIAVAAMMIGRIEDRYSEQRYDEPQPLRIGTEVIQGAPMMMFRPGSSTVLVLWPSERAAATQRLTELSSKRHVPSRFGDWLLMPWNEVLVRVRAVVADEKVLQP
jgi:phosphatidylserine decarboxylase